jgi:hypothetical protein
VGKRGGHPFFNWLGEHWYPMMNKPTEYLPNLFSDNFQVDEYNKQDLCISDPIEHISEPIEHTEP